MVANGMLAKVKIEEQRLIESTLLNSMRMEELMERMMEIGVSGK